MNLEVGQVWTFNMRYRYTIVAITGSTVIYTFNGGYGGHINERECTIAQFKQSLNEHVGCFLLTDLTKALI